MYIAQKINNYARFMSGLGVNFQSISNKNITDMLFLSTSIFGSNLTAKYKAFIHITDQIGTCQDMG